MTDYADDIVPNLSNVKMLPSGEPFTAGYAIMQRLVDLNVSEGVPAEELKFAIASNYNGELRASTFGETVSTGTSDDDDVVIQYSMRVKRSRLKEIGINLGQFQKTVTIARNELLREKLQRDIHEAEAAAAAANNILKSRRTLLKNLDNRSSIVE